MIAGALYWGEHGFTSCGWKTRRESPSASCVTVWQVRTPDRCHQFGERVPRCAVKGSWSRAERVTAAFCARHAAKRDRMVVICCDFTGISQLDYIAYKRLSRLKAKQLSETTQQSVCAYQHELIERYRRSQQHKQAAEPHLTICLAMATRARTTAAAETHAKQQRRQRPLVSAAGAIKPRSGAETQWASRAWVSRSSGSH